jgi:hypothetical protein
VTIDFRPVPLEVLERGWSALPAANTLRGTVQLIVVRTGDGNHATPARAELSPECGLVGDRWLLNPKRGPDGHISLIDSRVARLLTGGVLEHVHLPGDNFHVDLDLSEGALPVGTRLMLGTARVEISAKPHAGCAKFEARLGPDALRWVNEKVRRARRLRGVYAEVLEAGVVALGDGVERA